MKITSDITAALNATHEQRRTLFEGAAAGQPRDSNSLPDWQPDRNTLMEDDVDSDDLSPTEYLVMEVLAARFRLGERQWPFPNRVRPALRKLEAKGLIVFKDGVTEGVQSARLTLDGEHMFLDLGYVPMSERSAR